MSFLYQRNKVSGRHEICDLFQAIPAQRSRLRRKTTPLVIGKTHSASTQLLPENSILFFQVFDRVLLGSVNPRSEGQDEELS